MKKNGIYGYWDTQKECVVYIGKDSNISVNRRHKNHHAPSRYDEQRINRVLQNNEGRYTYFILCDGYFTEKELNELEEEAVAIFNTYYGYGFNFTKGGDGRNMCKEDHPFYGKHHTEAIRKKISKSLNTSGFYRVTKHNTSHGTQGFLWSYQYYIDGKQKHIDRVYLKDLEKVVRDKNLPWFIVDEEKAQKSLKEEIGKDTTNTGVYHVSKKKANNKHGFLFVYWFYDDNIHIKNLSSISIDVLKEKMIQNGHDFIILDDNKYQKALQDSINPEIYKKYALWDTSCVKYTKSSMMKDNSQNNPRKCFALKFNNKLIKMGINFFDFTSIEIIDNLIKEAI